MLRHAQLDGVGGDEQEGREEGEEEEEEARAEEQERRLLEVGTVCLPRLFLLRGLLAVTLLPPRRTARRQAHEQDNERQERDHDEAYNPDRPRKAEPVPVEQLIHDDGPDDAAERAARDRDPGRDAAVAVKIAWHHAGRRDGDETHAHGQQRALRQEELPVRLAQGDHEDRDELHRRTAGHGERGPVLVGQQTRGGGADEEREEAEGAEPADLEVGGADEDGGGVVFDEDAGGVEEADGDEVGEGGAGGGGGGAPAGGMLVEG